MIVQTGLYPSRQSSKHIQHIQLQTIVNWEISCVQIFWMTCWYPKTKNTKNFQTQRQIDAIQLDAYKYMVYDQMIRNRRYTIRHLRIDDIQIDDIRIDDIRLDVYE